MFGRIDFSTVWTSYAAPPHSVDQPQGDITHEKDNDPENCGVCVYDENEIVEVDHWLSVPRAGVRMLWIAVWIVSRIHRLYWPADGINLPRTKNAQFFYPSSSRSENRKRRLGLVAGSRGLLRLKNLVRVSDLYKTLQQ